MKGSTQEDLLAKRRHPGCPRSEGLSTADEEGRDDESHLDAIVACPLLDHGPKGIGVTGTLGDHMGTHSVFDAGGLRPGTDREPLDHLDQIASVKATRLAPKRVSRIPPSQLGDCPIRFERYSSRCGTMLIESASPGV